MNYDNNFNDNYENENRENNINNDSPVSYTHLDVYKRQAAQHAALQIDKKES